MMGDCGPRPVWRTVGLVALAVLAGTMLLFASWHVASTLGLRNSWGDTGRYLRASQVFSMPTEREVLYPVVLRVVRELLPRAMKFSGVQVLQLAAGFASAAYLAWAIIAAERRNVGCGMWDVGCERQSGDSGSSSGTSHIRHPTSHILIALIALLAIAEPVANHFHMTILTDSLAGSFMMTAFAALIGFAYDPARRKLHAGLAVAAFLLVGILRPEKAFMNAAMFATIIAVGWLWPLAASRNWPSWWSRRVAKPQAAQAGASPWRAWMTIAGLVLAVAIPVALVGKLATPRNKGKYPSMYDPRMLVLTRVHLQSFGDIYKKLDRRTRIMFSNHDAGRIDRHRANLNILIATRLREHPEFRGPIVEDIIATTWDEIPGKVLRQFAFDAGSYLLPPAGFYLELALPRKDAKLADFSRHTRTVMTNHQRARGVFPAWAVDAYLVVGAAWWVALIGTSLAAVALSPAARAVLRERAPLVALFAIYHVWAIFPFLILHNQFIVRYALPSYGVLMVALPTFLVLAYAKSSESRVASSELATSTAANAGLETRNSKLPSSPGVPA